MEKVKKAVIILVHAFVGWAMCGATMGIGMSVTSLPNTLVIHAIAAPIIFSSLPLLYFKKFRYTASLQTAIIFEGLFCP